MQKERKMVNLSRETASQLAQLKFDFAVVVGHEITYTTLIELLHKNRAAVIGSLKLMNRIKVKC